MNLNEQSSNHSAPQLSEIQRDLPAAPDCWYLAGPTASGKTRIGIQLAQALDAEIVSMDSMAIYQGMDIGTAKPSNEQRQQTPHHLLDIVPPTDDFSLSQYLEAAHAAIGDIRNRGKQVLVVGGTPLYLKSMLRGLFHGPPADWEFRNAIEAEVAEVGVEALHQRLQMVDPLSADKLHPNDKRRIIRALEVYRVTGQPLSHLQREFEDGRPAEACRCFVLHWPRDILHQRIEKRVEEMFERGLVAEVAGLLEAHGQLSRTASQAVGYREVMAHLQGETSLGEAQERVKASTRQFARRQETWFRSLSECRLAPLTDELSVEEVVQSIQQQGASLA